MLRKSATAAIVAAVLLVIAAVLLPIHSVAVQSVDPLIVLAAVVAAALAVYWLVRRALGRR